MMNKKAIFAIIIVMLLALGLYQGFLKKEKPTFTLAEVVRGNISQEVSETGQVKKGEEINLSFKNSGRIEKIYVEVSEEVKKGDILAAEESTQIKIQLQGAKVALSLAQAQLNKLLAGASPEEIQVAKTSVSNAEIALKDAGISLEDVESQAEENLNASYEDAENLLGDAYLKAYNAKIFTDLIQKTYFTSNDQGSLKVKENKDKIETSVSLIKSYLGVVKHEDIDIALSETKEALNDISNALKVIREVCEEPIYLNAVSSTDKTSLDTQRGYINTAITSVTNSQQTISSAKLTNEAEINAAKANVSTAEGALAAAKDQLSLITAAPRQEDIDLNQAKIDQAQSEINLLKAQIEDAILISPTNGEITQINKRIGEIAQPSLTEPVISLLPDNPFQITVDIYEEDVVKIGIGNSVDINLTAFPNEVFKGKVISIDPAEKIKEGVVYYETTIDFENPPEKIKPGMTADLTIKEMTKENVLVIPKSAIEEKENKTTVQVLRGKNLETREIEIGLKGSNDMVEVISGLKEGEEVAIK